MDFTRAHRTQINRNRPFTHSRIKLYEATEVILDFYI